MADADDQSGLALTSDGDNGGATSRGAGDAPACEPAALTEQTRRAMVAAEAKALGLIPDDSPSFSDVDSVMAYLDAE